MQISSRPIVHLILLAFYYLAIIAGLVLLYGEGDFTNPPFVYQDF